MRLPSLLALLLMLAGPPALADEVHHYGQLICEGNRALIRIATAIEGREPVFPHDPSAPPFAVAPVGGDSCRLANDREVKIKIGSESSDPRDRCGGRASFFSVWVGERKVLSRQPIAMGCEFDVEAYSTIVLLEDERLMACLDEFTFPRHSGTSGLGCKDESDRLRTAPRDTLEYPNDPATKVPPGTIQIVLSEIPEPCSAFLTQNPDSGPTYDALRQASTFWPRHFPDLKVPMYPYDPKKLDAGRIVFELPTSLAEKVEFEHVVHFPEDEQELLFGILGYARFDFDNDGKQDSVFMEHFGSMDRHGEIFHVFSDENALGIPDKIKAFDLDERMVWPSIRALKAMEFAPSVEYQRALTGTEMTFPEGSAPQFAALYQYDIPGLETGFPTYATLQLAFRYQDQTYVFTSAFDRVTQPKAVIYRPLPGGAAEPVCIYDMVQENY